jgi:hypothetical protein
MPRRKALKELMPRAYATRPGQAPTRTGFQPSQETRPNRVPRKPAQRAPINDMLRQRRRGPRRKLY